MIGYACLTVGIPQTNFRTCKLKNANDENLIDIIRSNLLHLLNVLDYNQKEGIKLYRISSDLIPFASSSVNTLKWWDIFSSELNQIKAKINQTKIRVTMHPGQYTVLNSLNEEVVERAIKDLEYHAKLLDSVGSGSDGKMILHVGGIYKNKEEAIKRFILNYHKLNENIKRRLVIENDDKSYNIYDCLEISKIIDIPIVYDNLHNQINCYDKSKDDFYWIEECKKTWKKEDGNQKIHYSEQDPLKQVGSHSQTINVDMFLEFYKKLNRDDIDIMLEVKDKNVSALNCIKIIKNIL